MRDTPRKQDDRDQQKPLGSPYGPQHGQVDESAGGADSSPLENVPSGEKADAARDQAAREADR